MSEAISAYPLCWPPHKPRTANTDRQYGRFSKKGNRGWTENITLHQATQRVLDELGKYKQRVDPDSIIISTNLKTRASDGLPKSGQRNPDDPGAAVHFSLDGKDKCIPIDTYTKIEQNLAAIAASILILRSLERYGSGMEEAAYTGFAALPDGVMTGEQPWYAVLDVDPDHRDMPELVERVYKNLRSESHPDKGGDPARFNQVQKAWEQYQAQTT